MTSGKHPDFLGLGAQKAGTSWLYACLLEHPQIFMPLKEAHFFSRDRFESQGYSWYESLFTPCPAGSLAGELSTSYLCCPDTPGRIAARYPKAKLIASLRHPVERAFSNFKNDLMAGAVRPTEPFLDALRTHPEYVEQGRYATQIRRFREHFPPEQLLVVLFDDIRADPAGVMRQVFRFLGVAEDFRPTFLDRRVNQGSIPRSLAVERVLRFGSSALRRVGGTGLWWAVKKTGIASQARALNTRQPGPGQQLTDDTRKALLPLFDAEIRELEQLLARPLASWRD